MIVDTFVDPCPATVLSSGSVTLTAEPFFASRWSAASSSTVTAFVVPV